MMNSKPFRLVRADVATMPATNDTRYFVSGDYAAETAARLRYALRQHHPQQLITLFHRRNRMPLIGSVGIFLNLVPLRLGPDVHLIVADEPGAFVLDGKYRIRLPKLPIDPTERLEALGRPVPAHAHHGSSI